jgi:hypothetical protein
MLNLFQHLIKSIYYETLKRVQGDRKWIVTQSRKRESMSNNSGFPRIKYGAGSIKPGMTPKEHGDIYWPRQEQANRRTA